MCTHSSFPIAHGGVLATVLLGAASTARGEAIRFLVAEPGPPLHGDSFVIVLEDEADIAHARALIRDPGALEHIVYAEIEAGADGINRDHLAEGAPEWSWHVTTFIGFVESTAEILDGWPSFVESDVEGWIDNTDGMIGFWTYTVTQELGPLPCPGDIAGGDGLVGFEDLLALLSAWGPCAAPCAADLTGDGEVGFGDLLLLLSLWGACP
jgi:hypothetical protein